MKELFICLLLITSVCKSQFIFGFKFEEAFFITNDFDNFSSKNKVSFSTANISFSLLFKFNDISGIDLRPGYSFNGIDYTGPEFGLYYNHNILNNLYIYAGGKAHLSIPENPDNNTYTTAFFSFGLGYNLLKILNAEIVFNKALKEKYANYKPDFTIYGEPISRYMEIYYDLRIGLGIQIN